MCCDPDCDPAESGRDVVLGIVLSPNVFFSNYVGVPKELLGRFILDDNVTGECWGGGWWFVGWSGLERAVWGVGFGGEGWDFCAWAAEWGWEAGDLLCRLGRISALCVELRIMGLAYVTDFSTSRPKIV